jgi:flagellar motor switch protein FliM
VSFAPPAAAVERASLIHDAKEQSAYPGLDRIAAKLAKGLAALIDQEAKGTTASLSGTWLGSFAEWQASAGDGLVSARFRMKPLKGWLLFVAPAQLIQSLVDRQFGGEGSAPRQQRDMVPSEHRYFERMAVGMAETLGMAWSVFTPVEPIAEQVDNGLRASVLVPSDLRIVAHQIAIQLPKGDELICHLVTPISMTKALPQLAEAVAEEAEPSADPAWQTAFSKAVMQAQLPVRTIFARPELPLTKLLTLKAGDVIPLALPDRLPVTVAGRHFASATIGEVNGRAAICIEKMEEGLFQND